VLLGNVLSTRNQIARYVYGVLKTVLSTRSATFGDWYLRLAGATPHCRPVPPLSLCTALGFSTNRSCRGLPHSLSQHLFPSADRESCLLVEDAERYYPLSTPYQPRRTEWQGGASGRGPTTKRRLNRSIPISTPRGRNRNCPGCDPARIK
jgi:hypothetical protein